MTYQLCWTAIISVMAYSHCTGMESGTGAGTGTKRKVYYHEEMVGGMYREQDPLLSIVTDPFLVPVPVPSPCSGQNYETFNGIFK